MKRSTKQLLSMLLAIMMVFGLMAPAMAARPDLGEVAETPVSDVSGAKLSGSSRPAVSTPVKAELFAAIEGANTAEPEESGTFVMDPEKNEYGIWTEPYASSDETLGDAGRSWVNDYFTGSKGVKIKSNLNGIELPKQEGGNVSFTVTGKATVSAVFANGSGGKAAAIALKKVGGGYVTVVSAVEAPNGVPAETPAAVPAAEIIDQNIVLQAGGYGAARLVTWEELGEGEYQLVSPVVPTDKIPATFSGVTYAASGDTDPNAKAARFYNLTVVQDASSASGGGSTTNTYAFDSTKIADGLNPDDATKAKDKLAVTKAELLTATTKNGEAITDDYFTVFTTNKTSSSGEAVTGSVIKRNSAKDDATPTAAIKGLEMNKIGTSGLDFTVEGEATASFVLASTSKTNESQMVLINTKTNAIVTPETEGFVAGQTDEKTPKTSVIGTGENGVDAGVVSVQGNNSKPTTVCYKLTAGDYRITTYDNFTGRGGWVIKADIVDVVEAKPVTDTYAFDSTKIADGLNPDDATKAKDKLAVTKAELLTATTKNGEAITDDYFTVFTTNKTSSSGEAVTGSVIKRNSAKNDATPTAAIKGLEMNKIGTSGLDFTVQGEATASFVLASTSKTNESQMVLINTKTNAIVTPETEGFVAGQTDETTPKTSVIGTGENGVDAGVVSVQGNNSKPTTVCYKLTAGDYRITTYDNFTGRGGWVIKADIVDTYMAGKGKTTRVDAPWTVEGIGAATVTPTVSGDKINVAVSGTKTGKETTTSGNDKTITTYADSLTVILVDSTGAEVGNAVSVDSGAATLTPSASGVYTVKAYAQREGETDLAVGTSSNVSFTLPLAVPSINSVASNGKESGKDTASVAVSWSSVPEASSYNLYVKAHDAADWGTATVIPATTAANVNATVTGLTVGSEYDFAVEAVRAATTIGGVSIAASTTAKSETESLEVTGTKQIPWTTKVFGTSATAKTEKVNKETPEISVVGLDGNPVTDLPSNVVMEGTVTYDFSAANKDGEVSSVNTHKETIEGLTGNLNTDPKGRVLLSSRDGTGKITEPNGSDGLMFHYTTVPAGYNFRLKAKVHVARWYTRDTQNGLGLAVLDRVPADSQFGSGSSNSGDFWNNSYMAGAARVGFTYDSNTGKTYGTGSAMSAVTSGDKSYSYYMGLCSILKHGNDKDHPSGSGNAPTSMFDRLPLDVRLAKEGESVKYNNTNNRFNTIGNYTKIPAGYSLQAEKSENASKQIMDKYEMTDFILQIEKTPTGYVSTAWTVDGELLGEVVQYYSKGAPELSACEGNSANNPYVHYANAISAENAVDLSGNVDKGIEIMDPSAEYVGFFTSRDTDAMFSEVEFEMTPQAEDDRPVGTPPVTLVTPKVSFVSGTSSNSEDFTLVLTTNVKGTVEVRKDGVVVGTVTMSDLDATGTARAELQVKLNAGPMGNTFTAKLTLAPEEEQGLPPYTELDKNAPTTATEANTTVTYSTRFANLTNIYVSPGGNRTGRGTRNSPTDIYTAVAAVQPGQNIIMLAGTYDLISTIDITPAMDGTEADPIYMGPEVDEDGNPAKVILNGQGSAGTVIKTGADWWVFDNFEVVNSSSGSKGFVVGGSHNIVQNISVHDNGSSGLSVTRYSNNVRIPVRDNPSVPADQVTDWGEWPCDNLILNCSSYRNYDMGYNGADGFEAKEAVGSGNVFDGCVAYWNADDGWDLYAKADADKGCLGVVTLKNCITFQNGYEVRKIIDSQHQTPALQEGSKYLPVMNTDADGNLVLADAGNGNGFKMGGSHMPGAHVITNSYAFMNKAKGFDSNNGPDISVIDCTAYNNGDENVGLSSNSTLAYVVNNVVSFKDDNCPVGNEGKPMMADQIEDGTGNKITNHYKWDGEKVTINGTNYTKADGAALFESLDFDAKAWWDGAQRSADGSLDLGDFMKLKLADVGAGDLVNDTQPVEIPDTVVNPPEEGSSDSVVSTGNGGGVGPNAGDKKDDDNKTDDTPVYTADKNTSVNGDTTVTVKDQNGEVVAEVKLPATIPAPETKFEDVADDHWAADAINNMAGLGVVNGVGDNLYSTDAAVTRATIATMLWRFANGKAGIDNTFADVADGMWYTDAIGWAAKVGVVTGYSEEAFGPNDTITREQLATMLARFAKLVGLDARASASALNDYQDKAAVSEWAVDGMAWCVQAGIINGVSADTLSPATSATRAQTALMLDRFIALMK